MTVKARATPWAKLDKNWIWIPGANFLSNLWYYHVLESGCDASILATQDFQPSSKVHKQKGLKDNEMFEVHLSKLSSLLQKHSDSKL